MGKIIELQSTDHVSCASCGSFEKSFKTMELRDKKLDVHFFPICWACHQLELTEILSFFEILVEEYDEVMLGKAK